jgi:hypothetical protein
MGMHTSRLRSSENLLDPFGSFWINGLTLEDLFGRSKGETCIFPFQSGGHTEDAESEG